MKKNLKSRLLSSFTAISLALSTFSGAVIQPVVGDAAEESVTAGNLFDYTYRSSDPNNFNDYYARINFASADGTSESPSIPDNTYYLLVEAVGEGMGSVGNYYKLFEIGSEGEFDGSYEGNFWSTPAFNVFPMAWGYTGISMKGTLLKNKDTSRSLNPSDAQDLKNCEVVNRIGSYTIGSALDAPNFGANDWYKNTFSIDATSGQKVNVKFYDTNVDGSKTLAPLTNDAPHEHYYVLGVAKKGSDVAGWDIVEIDPEAEEFGGTGIKNEGDIKAINEKEHDLDYCVSITLPPLGVTYYKLKEELPVPKKRRKKKAKSDEEKTVEVTAEEAPAEKKAPAKKAPAKKAPAKKAEPKKEEPTADKE